MNLSAVQRYESESGKTMAILHWYAIWGGWKREFSRADLEAVGNRGSLPMITWEPWASQPNDPAWSLRNGILSGKHDAYIAGWAQGLAAYGRPVLLRFAHEMHNQTYPWALGVNGNTAADYVAAWRKVHSIFRQQGATNVLWVWNPNTLGDRPSSAYDDLYRSLYPGDAYVDWFGLDIFNTGPVLDWGAPYWRSFTAALAPPYEALRRIGTKPIVLAEVGSTETGGNKATWITDAYTRELAQFPQVRAIAWFDIDKEQPWLVDSSAASHTAFVSSLRDPRFVPFAEPVAATPSPSAPSPTSTASVPAPTATVTPPRPTATATPSPTRTPSSGKPAKPPKGEKGSAFEDGDYRTFIPRADLGGAV
jgi:beta-mannanase